MESVTLLATQPGILAGDAQASRELYMTAITAE